jgi:hypothetical protein
MGSQYRHGHQYDLFVSYSTRDVNWVRQFYDDLLADLNRFAVTDVYLFLDKARLQPGHVWEEEILQSVADSAILVPVLSPRFFESDYCQKELNEFLVSHELRANALGIGAAHRSQIFPIKLLCAAPSDHMLAKVQAQAFYAERDRIPYEYLAGSLEYRDALRRTAYTIAQALETLPPKLRRPAVYLASDFKPHSDQLRASLGHTFDVLPGNPAELLGLGHEELEAALTRDFERCFVSVHVLTDTPVAKALIDLQLAFGKQSSKPRLVWTPGTASHEDLANAGFECNFSNQAEVEDRIRRIYEKPVQSKPGNERLIYFICPNRQNKTRAERLISALEEVGIDTFPSPIDGPADEALQAHVKALNELDGCLIYYGAVERDWFDATFLRLRKTIRKRNLPSAIYPAPPPTEHKMQDLRHCGIPLLDQATEEQAARAFAALMRGA